MGIINIIKSGISWINIILLIIGVVVGVIAWIRGIAPVLWRLGNGLARRKIALFAKGDNLVSLTSLLIDSKLFNEKNIIPITKKEDTGKSENMTLFLVCWPDWKDDIDSILDEKSDGSALLVYSPTESGQIDKTITTKLDKERNVLLSNFRGRLLSDLVASMIITHYKNPKKGA